MTQASVIPVQLRCVIDLALEMGFSEGCELSDCMVINSDSVVATSGASKRVRE